MNAWAVPISSGRRPWWRHDHFEYAHTGTPKKRPDRVSAIGPSVESGAKNRRIQGVVLDHLVVSPDSKPSVKIGVETARVKAPRPWVKAISWLLSALYWRS